MKSALSFIFIASMFASLHSQQQNHLIFPTGSAHEIMLTTLRSGHATRIEFRQATMLIGHLLAGQVLSYLAKRDITIETPLEQTRGVVLRDEKILLVPILRSGLSLLQPFFAYFPDAAVGMVGFKRDEKTAQAHQYYCNVPAIDAQTTVIILDPMLATGGTLSATIELLKAQGAHEQQIIFVGVIAASQGIATITERFPGVTLILADQDQVLNSQKYIVPGLGDYGDRYYGTE